ncbi:hypothetical protein PGIGA_G00007670 [Pangasianodon gigas]|uniref:Uncharacterized protein n=1 Tax=Pangasianodon gigas TaxID=30993 RepID=A0ACC5W6W6_PANGG|nr:hypothetical protein [Pangasianodon gigas]
MGGCFWEMLRLRHGTTRSERRSPAHYFNTLLLIGLESCPSFSERSDLPDCGLFFLKPHIRHADQLTFGLCRKSELKRAAARVPAAHPSEFLCAGVNIWRSV